MKYCSSTSSSKPKLILGSFPFLILMADTGRESVGEASEHSLRSGLSNYMV
jgi:hypothetical protein